MMMLPMPHPPFDQAVTSFFYHIIILVNKYQYANELPIHHIILVAHNGRHIDVPFLLKPMDKYGKTGIWSQVPRFGYAIETLELARNAIRIAPCRELRGGIPSSYSLGSLYQYLTGEMLSSAHRAEADVIATIKIFLHKLFWPYQGMFLLLQFRKILTIESPSTIQANVQYDSDSAESSAGSLSSESNSLNSSIAELTINQEEPMGDVWKVETDFEPTRPTLMQKFEESFTWRSTRIKSGLQCSPSSVNTPSKAWRQIFTNSILDKIVGYTD